MAGDAGHIRLNSYHMDYLVHAVWTPESGWGNTEDFTLLRTKLVKVTLLDYRDVIYPP